MIKKFEKKLELVMGVTKHRVEGDMYIFILKFDRNIRPEGEDPVTSVEFHVFLVTDDYWFTGDYPRLPDNDDVFGVDLFNDDDGNYILFNSLFNSEDEFYKIVQQMCIDYCKENKLPDCIMSTDVVQDELNIFTDDILDMIGKSEIDITSEFNIVGKYYEDNFFKETEFTVTKDSLKLENMIVNMEFKRNDDENDFSQFINKCTIEFMNKWNKEIVGKYDWDKINCMEDMNSILE